MSLADLERELLRVASCVPRMKVAEEDGTTDPEEQATAQRLLQDAHTTATGCFRATERLCGPGFRAWEPESIWLTLERRGVDVPVLNRDKILAASTLTIIPAFWFEVNAFENTVMAFNNVLSEGEILQEATPAQLNWAVYEAEMLYSQASDIQETTEFDREPIGYTAIVLNRAGFILAPELLSFAQDALDDMTRDGAGISKKDVKSAWKGLQKKDLTKVDFKESPLDMQLARLTAVQLYLYERLQQYESDITQLGL
jgi:hypothetical protein